LFRERQQKVICVVAVAMVSGFVLFRYVPLRKRMKALEQRQAAQKLAITKVSAQSEQLPRLSEQLLELQRATGNYEQQVPMRRELGVFLHRIANLMNEHNLKEQLIEPGKEIQTGELNCIPVNMQCKGKLAQVYDFYRRLQELDRLVRIEQVRLVNESDFSGEVKIQTKASIYYRPVTGRG